MPRGLFSKKMFLIRGKLSPFRANFQPFLKYQFALTKISFRNGYPGISLQIPNLYIGTYIVFTVTRVHCHCHALGAHLCTMIRL
jgi:hypothetical protein